MVIFSKLLADFCAKEGIQNLDDDELDDYLLNKEHISVKAACDVISEIL